MAFAIAVIGLGAKIAKADGRVTRNEVSAFREVFQIPESEEANAARVYNLARQDVAGFEEYARKIKAMFGDEKGVLCDLIEGLLFIAMADGEYHDGEDELFDAGGRDIRLQRVPNSVKSVPAMCLVPNPILMTFWAWLRAHPMTRSARPGGIWCAKPIPTGCWRAACRKRRCALPSAS